MKKPLLYLILAGLIFLFWLLKEDAPKEVPEKPQKKGVKTHNKAKTLKKEIKYIEKKTISESNISKNKIPRPVTRKESRKQIFSKQQKWIEYDLNEGWAITQGDILLGRPMDGDAEPKGRVAAGELKFWKGGVIPFSIHPDTPNKEVILRALDEFNNTTHLNFVHVAETDRNSIVFVKSEGIMRLLPWAGGRPPTHINICPLWLERNLPRSYAQSRIYS